MGKLLNRTLLSRLYEIDKYIKKGYIDGEPVNKRTLAKTLAVSQKTIQRDLEYLKTKYNAPIKYNNKERKLYYDKNFSLSPLELNENDFFAIAVTEKVLRQYKGTVYENYLKSFYEKINSMFGNEAKISLENVEDLISFQIGPIKEIDKKIFDTLETAMYLQKTVSIDYYSVRLNRQYSREFDPYHLRNYMGNWYLIGYDHLKKKIRVLNVSRINAVNIIKTKRFSIQENFNVNDYFMYSFGNYVGKNIYDIKIKFFPTIASKIKEKIWHHTQSIKELKDGSIIISFKLNSLKEIMKWILQYGRNCKVISPQILRKMVKEELQFMAKLYS